MTPRPKSAIIPLAITVLISALVFGFAGFYVAKSMAIANNVFDPSTAKVGDKVGAFRITSLDGTPTFKGRKEISGTAVFADGEKGPQVCIRYVSTSVHEFMPIRKGESEPRGICLNGSPVANGAFPNTWRPVTAVVTKIEFDCPAGNCEKDYDSATVSDIIVHEIKL